jgi:hypothetical protein
VAWLTFVLMGARITGCAKTVEEQGAVVQQVQSGSNAAVAGFFGNEASLLQPGQPGQAAMVYINPNVQWQQHNKVMIEPVQFWDDLDTKVSPSDQHVLTAYFYNSSSSSWQRTSQSLIRAGRERCSLQVALVNTKAATPGLRTVSVIVPQARILNLGQSLATGSYAFAGSAEAEMKLTDSSTGQLLAAAIDQRGGGMALSTAEQWQWGDAQNAMNYWAQKISGRLLELQGRAPTPSS